MLRRFLPLALALAGLLSACVLPTPARQYLVFFPKDEMTLTPDAQAVVADVAKTAATYRPKHVIVEGQADGGTPHDAELAAQRGQAVATALIGAGIDPARIQQTPGAPDPGQTGVVAHKVVVRLES